MSDEHLVAIVSFEGALKREIRRMRKKLAQMSSLTSFELLIKVSGRIHEGDLKLEYCLASSHYVAEGGDTVKGNTVDATVDEYLRRKGWTEINAPKEIGYDKVPDDDTDIDGIGKPTKSDGDDDSDSGDDP